MGQSREGAGALLLRFRGDGEAQELRLAQDPIPGLKAGVDAWLG